jgi:O-antigen/teichoic acid export membrane protein
LEFVPRGTRLLLGRGFAGSIPLIAAHFVKLASGALFWILAARFFRASDVGLAASIVSLFSIAIVVGLLGAGASVIRLFPDWRHHPQPLFKSAATIALVSSVVTGCIAVVVAGLALDDLTVLASDPALTATFVIACMLGGLLLLGDQISIAMWQGTDVFTRAFVTGVVMIGALAGLAAMSGTRTVLAIMVCWTLGRVVALLLNVAQVRRSLEGTAEIGSPRRSGIGYLLRLGVRNHALTIFELAPGFAITIIVTEVVSAESGAYWYSAWMTATAVFIVPGMFGMTLFAAAVEPGRELARAVRESLRGSFALGIVGAVLVSALARPLLELFGGQYAEAGVAPLRVLVIAVVPLTLVSAYFALCRATDRLGEATALAILAGGAGLTVATLAGIEAGLVEVAAGWLGVQAVAGAWAAWRLKVLTRHGIPTRR